MNLNLILERLPLARSVFLVYAIVGAIMLIGGTLEYGSFADNLLAIGIAVGAIGVPRAIAKVQNGVSSQDSVIGFLEQLQIAPIVFILFLLASTVSVITGAIEFGAFSDNVMKVGIACGVVLVPQVAEIAQAEKPTISALSSSVGSAPASPPPQE